MIKLNSIEEVKSYLDRLKLKNIDDFQGEEYLPLDEFFIGICQHNSELNIQLRQFTYNMYLDEKIIFEEMVKEIEKDNKQNYKYIVHEMAKDEARHGSGFADFLKDISANN